MRTFQTLLFGLVTYFLSSYSFATSCRFMVNEYYLLCEQGICTKGIESFKVSVSPYCSRHSEIGVAPDWVLRFAEKVLELKRHDIGNGIIKMDDSRFFHHNKRVNSLEEFIAIKGKKVNYFSKGKYEENSDIEFSELVSRIDKVDQRWFYLYNNETTIEALEKINRELMTNARNEKAKWYAYKLVYWGGAFFLMLTFIWTINNFYYRLYNRCNTSAVKAVRFSLGVQLLLLALGIVVSLFSFIDYTPLLFLAPAMFLVLLAELAQIIVSKYRKP